MPALAGWIGTMLWAAVRAVGPTILATLGLSLVTEHFVGSVVMPNIASLFAGVPDYALQTLGAMNADRCFSILLSAITVRAGVRSVSSIRFARRGGGVS